MQIEQEELPKALGEPSIYLSCPSNFVTRARRIAWPFITELRNIAKRVSSFANPGSCIDDGMKLEAELLGMN